MVILIIILLSLIVLLLLSLLVVFLLFAFDTFLDLPYVATGKEKIPTIIKLANIKSGDIAIDLGSGDGRLLFAAAAKSGVHAIGYEVNPFLVVLTKILALFKGLSKKIEVRRQNLWDADLSSADVIFVYGRAKTMPKFENFLYQNAKKRTRLIVNTDKTVPFPTKKPIKSENGIYLYKV